jgi:ABC-2 type transport system permease protein
VTSTTTSPQALPVASEGILWLLRDAWSEAVRHLRAMPRSPELILYAVVQPIMFVLLFVYVFGGSLVVPGYDDYKQYLVPGVFAQTALWGSAFTGVGVAEDRTSGLVDRLRSLPIAPSSVLVGRTISDLVRNTLTFVVMFVVAWMVGFQFLGSVGEVALATALLFAFSYAFSWVQAYMGLSVKSVEAANSAGYIWMFPLTFVSSAFVDPENMPSWMQPIAEANPFTVLTDAGRALYNGQDPGSDPLIAMVWAVGITAVFAVLCNRKVASASR